MDHASFRAWLEQDFEATEITNPAPRPGRPYTATFIVYRTDRAQVRHKHTFSLKNPLKSDGRRVASKHRLILRYGLP